MGMKIKVFESFEKLKADRVFRPLSKKEKVKQQKATDSLKKLKINRGAAKFGRMRCTITAEIEGSSPFVPTIINCCKT